MTKTYHLAQLNVATPLYTLDDPRMADFVDNLERINGLAEASPGFVWRLTDEDGADNTLNQALGDNIIFNISLWADIASLRFFLLDTEHADFMRRRREWFKHLTDRYVVLWWVEAGHQPSAEEAKTKLEKIRRDGPSASAFNLGKPFDPPIIEPAGR